MRKVTFVLIFGLMATVAVARINFHKVFQSLHMGASTQFINTSSHHIEITAFSGEIPSGVTATGSVFFIAEDVKGSGADALIGVLQFTNGVSGKFSATAEEFIGHRIEPSRSWSVTNGFVDGVAMTNGFCYTGRDVE